MRGLSSPRSRRNYRFPMEQIISWYCSEPRLALNRSVVLRFRLHLESLGLAAGTINQRLAALRRLAYEAADPGLLSPKLAAVIRRVKGVKQLGCRAGNWLNREQAQLLLEKSNGEDLRSVRDVVMISILLGCGLRRAELSARRNEDIQMRRKYQSIQMEPRLLCMKMLCENSPRSLQPQSVSMAKRQQLLPSTTGLLNSKSELSRSSEHFQCAGASR
jgi:site-specific recombinase XerC